MDGGRGWGMEKKGGQRSKRRWGGFGRNRGEKKRRSYDDRERRASRVGKKARTQIGKKVSTSKKLKNQK